MQDIVRSAADFHLLVCLFAEQEFDHTQLGVGTNDGQLQWGKVIDLMLEGALVSSLISCFNGLHINQVSLHLAEDILKDLGLAVVGGSTHYIRGNCILSSLAEADVADIIETATSCDKELKDLKVAMTSSLDDEWRHSVVVSAGRVYPHICH